MPNIKKFIQPWSETGKTVYGIIRREADIYLLNDADGAFASAPADPYISFTEHGTIKGQYELSESRTTWSDGRYIITAYKQAGGSPSPVADTIIGAVDIYIVNDTEIIIDASVSTQTVKIAFIEKWINNKLIEGPVGTWKLYDDDNITVLKTWTWNTGTLTRSKAT